MLFARGSSSNSVELADRIRGRCVCWGMSRFGRLGIPVVSCLMLAGAVGCAKRAPTAAEVPAAESPVAPVATASPAETTFADKKEDAKDVVAAPPTAAPGAMASAVSGARPMGAPPKPSKSSMGDPFSSELDDSPAPARAGGFGVSAGFSGVKAGEWDDNANFREFQRFLATSPTAHRRMDLSARQFVVVRDKNGHGVPRCRVTVRDERQGSASFLTTASGRAIVFPRAEGLWGTKLVASAECAEGSTLSVPEASLQIDGQQDGVLDLRLGSERAAIGARTVDLAFVLDTTGSMAEEITAVKSTIQKVAKVLSDDQTTVRIGLVEYKDRSDPFVTKVYPFATDLVGFAQRVSQISASGGGDMPEDMNAGLHSAMTKLAWSDQSVARLAFVIADAPPHLDYQDGPDYAADMKTASRRGIQLFTVAASGMDNLGQVVFRQMAQYTGGTNMFVLRGGAGPQSTGGGDPVSSCGGTHTNYSSGKLDELIVQKIRRELKALDADPMRIAGLRADENAKPCDQRVVFAD